MSRRCEAPEQAPCQTRKTVFGLAISLPDVKKRVGNPTELLPRPDHCWLQRPCFKKNLPPQLLYNLRTSNTIPARFHLAAKCYNIDAKDMLSDLRNINGEWYNHRD